ncbi:MAG: hypothetical protein HYV60_13640 [Planctomycetia bacterium]|nr:hypothetical protein [Planctomycetia bacterium]
MPFAHTPDDRWVTVTESERGVTSFSILRIDDFSEQPIANPERWKLVPRILDEQRLIGFARDEGLLVVNRNTGAEQHFPLPPAIAIRLQYHVARPDRILIFERPKGGGGADKWRLISLTEPITQLAEWNSTRCVDLAHNDEFYMFNADADRLQQLSLEDGSVVEEYSLAPLFEKVPAAEGGTVLPQRKLIGVYDPTQKRCLLYNFDNDEIMDCLPPDVVSVHASKDESYLVLGRESKGESPGVSIFDLDTLSMQWLHQSRQALATWELSRDESQLITVRYDGSVRVLDVTTGEVLRTYRSRAAVLPVFGSVLVGFIVWCVLWVRAGTKLHSSPLVDAIFLNGLIAAAFIVRVNLSGSMQDASRFAYQTAQSLFASWLVLLTCWVVFGKARWSLRVLAPLLGVAVTLTFVLLNFRGDHFGVWQLVIGAFVVSLVGTLWFSLLRRWGYSLSDGDRVAISPSREPRSIPLRDLFFITAAVAALLAVVRFVTPHMFAAHEAAALALIVTTISLTGVAATWAGFSRRHWIVRLLFLSLVVFAAGSVLPAVFPNLRHWYQWRFIAKYQAFIALFTLGTTLIFRSRGWRLRRAARN